MSELIALLSEQVAAEINREILRNVREAAPSQLKWDGNGFGIRESLDILIDASAQIHKSTLMGDTGVIVVSPEVSVLFDSLECSHATNAAPEDDQYSIGIEKPGILQGRYQIFCDPSAQH